MAWYYRALYKKYRDLYVKKLLDTLTSEPNKQALDDCEMALNIESIVMARKEAELMVCIDFVRSRLLS